MKYLYDKWLGGRSGGSGGRAAGLDLAALAQGHGEGDLACVDGQLAQHAGDRVRVAGEPQASGAPRRAPATLDRAALSVEHPEVPDEGLEPLAVAGREHDEVG